MNELRYGGVEDGGDERVKDGEGRMASLRHQTSELVPPLVFTFQHHLRGGEGNTK